MVFDSNSYGFWFQSYFDQIVFLISNNILGILENEKSMEISEKSLDNLCRNIFFLTIIFPARAAGWKNLMKFIIIQKLLSLSNLFLAGAGFSLNQLQVYLSFFSVENYSKLIFFLTSGAIRWSQGKTASWAEMFI